MLRFCGLFPEHFANETEYFSNEKTECPCILSEDCAVYQEELDRNRKMFFDEKIPKGNILEDVDKEQEVIVDVDFSEVDGFYSLGHQHSR